MIERILTIEKFGVFNDFNWNRDSTLQDFKEKNIIYGWNYSGKTTLSRIFCSLRDKKIHLDYPEAKYYISTVLRKKRMSLLPLTLLPRTKNITNKVFEICIGISPKVYIEYKV
jgi:hypothetical protein